MSDFRYVRPDNFPPVVKNLIIINILFYIAQAILDSQFHLTEKLMLYPVIPEKLQELLLQHDVISASQQFKPYQVFTHMFAHAPFPQLSHIIFNMFSLWMFGRILENVWGGKRFLTFYLLCGIGAAACHLAMQYFRSEQLLQAILNNSADQQRYAGALAPALGASGAIMGVFVAYGYLFPNSQLYIMFFPFPIKAKWAVIGFAAIDLFGGVANMKGDNIAHFAHLGGAITGFIIVLIWNKTNRKTLY